MIWLLLAAIVTIVVYYRRTRRRLYQLAKQLPSGLKVYPIIGHAYIFLGSSENQMKGLQNLGLAANQHGGVSHWWLGHKLYITLTDAKAIEIVTKTCLDKDTLMRLFWPITGNGSVFAPVNIWHPRRKILTNFFKLSNLKKVVKLFDEKSNILVKLMHSEVSKGDFAAWSYFTTYTFDTICESAAGLKVHAQENYGHWCLDAMDEVVHMIARRVLQPWLHPDFIYKRLPVYQQFQKHRKRIYDFIDKQLQMTRKEVVKKQCISSTNTENDTTVNFLEIAWQSPGIEDFTDSDLREEAIVIATAGNDTSAVASCFVSVMLSRYPDVQEKVYQELLEVFGDSDRSVNPEDMPKLKYLEAVIKETLRLYPPVPVVTREVHEDVVLPSGVTLVDGTSVMINIWGTHRNAKYWGLDAEQFRPERFLEGPLAHPAMFIPFSYSLRGCIGYTYAMFSMKTALANLLRSYRLLPPTNINAGELRAPLKVKFEIMMKVTDNFMIRIEERNKM